MADKAQPRRKRNRQAELNPHDYPDPEQTAKLEAMRAEENRRALLKELDEREAAEKHRVLLAGIYEN